MIQGACRILQPNPTENVPCTEISAEWASQRIKNLDLGGTLGRRGRRRDREGRSRPGQIPDGKADQQQGRHDEGGRDEAVHGDEGWVGAAILWQAVGMQRVHPWSIALAMCGW